MIFFSKSDRIKGFEYLHRLIYRLHWRVCENYRNPNLISQVFVNGKTPRDHKWKSSFHFSVSLIEKFLVYTEALLFKIEDSQIGFDGPQSDFNLRNRKSFD